MKNSSRYTNSFFSCLFPCL